jgi:hypothetical protein
METTILFLIEEFWLVVWESPALGSNGGLRESAIFICNIMRGTVLA